MSIANKIIPLLLILLLSVACGSLKKQADDGYAMPLMIGNKKIYVEKVDTKEKMTKGLSGREKLKENQGMLFDFNREFPKGTTVGFWMKEMKFDLDLIWINDRKIIAIESDVPAPKSPGDSLPLYYPPSMIDMVLEVNAGWSKENDVKIGDEVKFEN